MILGGNANLASVNRDNSKTQFCPECGQPLTLAQAKSDHRIVVSWRSIFLVTVGLYLATTFGVGAWHAERANGYVAACSPLEVERGCTSAPRGLVQQVAFQYLKGGDVLAARLTDRDVGSDLRYLVVGLTGLCVGLGVALLRLKRPRRFAFGVDLFLAVEGLLTVFYGQVLLLDVYLLVEDSPMGAPLTMGILGDSLFRALSMVFALVGIQ